MSPENNLGVHTFTAKLFTNGYIWRIFDFNLNNYDSHIKGFYNIQIFGLVQT